MEGKKKKKPRSGSSEQPSERTSGVRECCRGLVEALNWSGWMDGCCSRVLRPLGVAYSRALGSQGLLPLAILLLGSRGLESHINLSLRLRSEEVPLEEKRRAHTRLPLREAAV